MILVLDCAILTPAKKCFQELQSNFNFDFLYHSALDPGIKTLEKNSFEMIIIFGSASNVSEKLSWHENLSIFISNSLKKNIPVLAICFGHQLMAEVFGAKVNINPNKEKLSGLRSISFNKHNKLKIAGNLNFLFEHTYQVSSLTHELEIWASSEVCEAEVVTHKTLPFIGIQAHPEASNQFIVDNNLKMITPREIELAKNDSFIFMQKVFRYFRISERDQLLHQ